PILLKIPLDKLNRICLGLPSIIYRPDIYWVSQSFLKIMKFGLNSEKHLYDMRKTTVSSG
ncbi:MAG: hypothetical protein ACXV2C_04490, partial [Candidatus Bathyarchaeia archaeon]